MNLGHMMTHTNHNVPFNGQGNGTLGIFHHSKPGSQYTSHEYGKGMWQSQKFMQTKQPLKTVQKLGFGQHNTQFKLQEQTFKRQGIGAIGTHHLGKIATQFSSTNIGNGFVKHVAQTNKISSVYGHYLSHGMLNNHGLVNKV